MDPLAGERIEEPEGVPDEDDAVVGGRRHTIGEGSQRANGAHAPSGSESHAESGKRGVARSK